MEKNKGESQEGDGSELPVLRCRKPFCNAGICKTTNTIFGKLIKTINQLNVEDL